MKPDYRVKIEFYDDSTSEVVCFSDEPLWADDDEQVVQMRRTIEKFNKDKVEHEATHYPKDEIE